MQREPDIRNTASLSIPSPTPENSTSIPSPKQTPPQTPPQAPLRRMLIDRPEVATAITLGVVATAVSAAGSWIPSLWGDEGASVLSAQRSLPSLFRMLGNVDAVHGTYYFFLHFWVQLFGSSPFSVRFPSALAIGVMVAGLVLLCTKLDSRRTGVFAGIVALALPRVTNMGDEARGYAISAACVVWVTYLLVRIVSTDRPSRRLWILYALGIAACGYIFLFSLLIVVAHAVIVLGTRKRSIIVAWFIAALCGVAIAGPVIGFGIGERGQVAFLATQDNVTFRTLAVTQWFGNSAMAVLAWALIVIALGAWVVGAWVGGARVSGAWAAGARRFGGHRITGLHPVPIAATWLVAPLAILIAINSVHAVYTSRYLSFAAPAAAVLIAWTLARIRPIGVAVVVLVLIIATSSTSYLAERTPYAKNNSDWAQIAHTIKQYSQPGDGILFDESTRPSKAPRLALRTYPAAFAGLTDIALDQPWYDTNNWHDSVHPSSSIPARIGNITTVWLVEYRLPGATVPTYDRSELTSLGFAVIAEYPLHSSFVIKLTRP